MNTVTDGTGSQCLNTMGARSAAGVSSMTSKLVRAIREIGGRLIGKKQRHMKLGRELIAETFLKGEGIEIGALHNPLLVPNSAKVKYVDRLSVADLRRQYPELDSQQLVDVD